MTPNNFEQIYLEGYAAGMEAGKACVPAPMIVGTAKGLSDQIDYSKPTHFVSQGVCGFAWVHIKGNTAFGRWAKKTQKARSSYYGGLDIWCSEFGQSMEQKEAWARAFAKVLGSHGIEAYSTSRMD